ncbi:TPA: hypothetical protein ACUU9M_004214 [Yersinia enterocolitica]|uniref:Uncharacterized protein n=1 Tax=Yersinia kristensenii TaxID=28152 RepID=A0AB73P1A7_YERKR|nr:MULTISPECIES: hypothetical protein [Yersinia]HDL6649123.1 hypothetical protein [Yersinia enterocolitica]OVZ78395.1 hypothetical protein CBW52_18790 [Yersinia kristensenii]HDW7092832.1 hypothetical protein [Yersinia enterocolitica]HEB0973866.1 hypothetical protein [Yersinia enterocolitica]HEB1850863.1 hypothetical protein [Yersinia enterocolitica]
MKLHIIISALSLIISSSANAAKVNQELCSTVTFQAFGEPKQTVRDCADPHETFWAKVDINGVHFPIQGIGLIVPQTYHAQSSGESELLTIQVTKKEEAYNIRFQAIRDNKLINWSGMMIPGEHKSVNQDGNQIKVSFARQ